MTMENGLAALKQAIHETYQERTPASAAWYERASNALIGGVSGTVRFFPPYPLYFEGGHGSKATDIDGNDYIDCFLCGACLLLGHRAPVIMDAIKSNADKGTLILNPRHSTETAEMMQKIIPSAEKVRFLNSGTEAVMSALRFARAHTGRAKIIKFLGTYHGMEDQMLVGLDNRAICLGAGIPPGAVEDIVMIDFGDMDALHRELKGGDVAGILVDPSMHHGGMWIEPVEYYQAVRQAASDAGAVLIYDEVIAGFRLAAGGGQEYFGVTPDLAVFGKAFSAGEKLGAVVGKADVMGVADPSGRSPGPFAFQSGTGNDTTFSQVAALAAMGEYKRLGASGGYDAIGRLALRLGEGSESGFCRTWHWLSFQPTGPDCTDILYRRRAKLRPLLAHQSPTAQSVSFGAAHRGRTHHSGLE